MNKSELVFDYLKDSLIQWNEKTTQNSVDGDGFNENNVVDIDIGALPKSNEFDYIYMSPPIVNQSGVTTGSQGVQRSTQTFVIDTYCKRKGIGNDAKRKTLQDMRKNTEFISNLFAKQGFTIMLQMADLNYNNNSTARQVITVTKTFV